MRASVRFIGQTQCFSFTYLFELGAEISMLMTFFAW